MQDRAELSNRLRWHWIVQHVKGRILDVGSGAGETWRQTGFQGDVTLVDLACYVTGYPFVWADAHHLPFNAKAFDTVVLSEVLEHVLNPDKVLEEAVRVCRERLVITVPVEKHFTPRNERLKSGEYERSVLTISQLRKDVSEWVYPHHWHIRKWTERGFRKFLHRHKLKIRLFKVQNLNPFIHILTLAEVESLEEKEKMEEEEVAEEAVEEAHVEDEPRKKAEKLPAIFVIDHSKPAGSLTGARVLVDTTEKKIYPMDDAANAWVRDNNIPIKEPSDTLKAKLADYKAESTYADLVSLTSKIKK